MRCHHIHRIPQLLQTTIESKEYIFQYRQTMLYCIILIFDTFILTKILIYTTTS